MAAPDSAGHGSQPSLLTDAETEAIRPGSTRPWNPAAASGYLTGVGAGEWHAVPRAARQRAARGPGPAEALAACQEPVLVAARHGTYNRLSPATASAPCPQCAWHVAIETGSTGRELALITPGRADAAAVARSGADPVLAARVCQAVLAAGADTAEAFAAGLDDPAVAQVLALATRHRPVLYVTEECADGACQPEGEEAAAEHSCDGAQAGCAACAPHAGSWAGEYEGTPLRGLLVPAPCSVLAVLAARYLAPAL